MPVNNNDVADMFNRVADLLEIKGDNPFRIRSYRNAARTIENLPQNITEMISRKKDPSELPGIGKDLAGKIKTILKTGNLPLLEELRRELPKGLEGLIKIPTLGPKRVHILYSKLKITNIEQLRKAAENCEIRKLDGFGEKIEKTIIEEIQYIRQRGPERTKLVVAEQIAASLTEYLKNQKSISRIEAAGSYRRCRETVRDLDILVGCGQGSKVMDRFVNYPEVQKVVSNGKTRSTVIMRTGFQVDLRVVSQKSYGAAMCYFTGSKEHNIAIRKMALKKNLKINEYGVFEDNKQLAGATEQEVYEQLGLGFIEPELRENRGEIEAAAKNRLPKLINLEDIRGDLHMHTTYTDGNAAIEQMAEAAKKKGYEYIAITDHSQRVTVAHGLKPKQLRRQIEEIDKANEKVKGIVILKSIEVDILRDGSLDMPDEVLEELDLTVCAIHSNFNLPADKQTERIIKAMNNPYFTILSHPTGRMLNARRAYQLNMEKVMSAAKRLGRFLELNAHPYRLDLNDIHCKMAKDTGVKVVISTDAHSTAGLDYMRFGIGQARRGWLETGDVINSYPLEKLMKLLAKNRR